MPAIPSTCVPVDPLASVCLPDPNFFPGGEAVVVGRPTPDPDRDDVMLVQPEDGMISQASPSQCPPQANTKPPNIELGSLILHSPSSFVGTPFDPSPRFEYPFPPAGPPAGVVQELQPVVTSFHIIASPMAAFPSVMPPLSFQMPLPLPNIPTTPAKPRVDTRSFSPTHPKLQVRDPPIPPGLKRKINQSTSLTISIHGDHNTGPTVPSRRDRARSGSMSNLSDKLGRAGEMRDGRANLASVAEIAAVGEKKAHGHIADEKCRRHSLSLCERDRKALVEGDQAPLRSQRRR